MENIKLNGAKNIRDLGGMPVAGGVIKQGKILRASHLNAVSDSDLDTLILKYRLRTVIDLRNAAEKKEKPDRVLPDFNYLEMPVFDSSVPGLSHESKQDLNGIPDMRELYEYVMNSPCLDNLADVVRYIVKMDDDNFSVLYHCTEGKDRTGMVTALLLLVLGAGRKEILEDYLFTNTVNKKKAVKYFLLVRIFKHNKTAAKKVYRVFLAQEEYLNEVFKAVDKIGQENFIRNTLRLTEDEIEAFRRKVIE